MFSERIGWIPLLSEISDDVKETYKFVFGLSVTEMEIMHAAYRLNNPNGMWNGDYAVWFENAIGINIRV